jgi:hypothetical protein
MVMLDFGGRQIVECVTHWLFFRFKSLFLDGAVTPHVTGGVPGLYLDDVHFLDSDLVALARSVLCDKRRS